MKRKLLSFLAFALLAATGAWADETPQALWCEGNSTLYFINSETVYAADDTYDGQTVTKAWSGDNVTNTGSSRPGWYNYHEKIQNVVFDDSFADVHPTSCYWWFEGVSKLETLDVSNLNVDEVTNFSFMFHDCKLLPSLDVSGWDVSSATDMGKMFESCKLLTSLDLSGWDVSNVTEMSNMFEDCSSLTSLDISGWDVSSVEGMWSMFNGCSSLASLDVSGWDVSNVTDMSEMFSGCSSLTSLDLSSWDVSSVEDMYNMFEGCSSLTSFNLSGWNFPSVTDLSCLFEGCSSLTSLDLSGWDFSSVTEIYNMFESCTSLTSLDLSGLNFSSVEDMSAMFQGCTSLTTIYIDDSWDVSSVSSSENMFTDCVNLVGSITYDSEKTDVTYATAQGGYMTLRGPVTFSDTDDNSNTISTYDGYQAYVEMTRTLKTGGWNTFCVPFDAANPSGWTVKKLTCSSFSSGTLTLNFDDATSIEAGKPYLVKVEEVAENPTFEGVIVTDGTATTTETDNADFVPVINPTFLTGGDKSVLFVTGGNKLTYPAADGDINGFRAYFHLKGDAVAEARAFRMSFGEETGIETVLDNEPTTATSTFTLDGRRIQGQPTQKGLYVVNGKKTIIK